MGNFETSGRYERIAERERTSRHCQLINDTLLVAAQIKQGAETEELHREFSRLSGMILRAKGVYIMRVNVLNGADAYTSKYYHPVDPQPSEFIAQRVSHFDLDQIDLQSAEDPLLYIVSHDFLLRTEPLD